MVLSAVLAARPAPTRLCRMLVIIICAGLVVIALTQGRHVITFVRYERLAEGNDEITTAGHLCDPLGVEVLHDLRGRPNCVIARSELSTVILAPAINVTLLCKCHAESITDRHL